MSDDGLPKPLGSNGQNEATVDAARSALLDEAATKVQAAALDAAKKGARFTLAILANAPVELLHRAVRGAVPAAWRVTVPELGAFSHDQWRLVLTWLALEYRIGVEAGILEALKEIEADEREREQKAKQPAKENATP